MSQVGVTRRGFLPALLAGQAMATLDAAIVNVALPNIQARLHADDAAIQLLVAGYLISFGTLVVTGARLGARNGHRRVFLTGLAAFVAASMGCGLSNSAWLLVGGRIVQGAAGALMVPQVIALIQIHFAGEARARAIAVYSLVLSLGVLAGQILGGLIVSADAFGLGWRPIFLVNVPIGLVAFVLGRNSLPAAGKGAASRLDLAGVLMLGGSLAAILTPLVLGRTFGWPPWTWPTIMAGVGGLALFGKYERRLSALEREPVFDVRLFASRTIRLGGLAVSGIMAAYGALVVSLTLYLQEGFGYSALHSGSVMACYAAGFGVASLSMQRITAAVGVRVSVAAFAGFGIAALGIAASAQAGWPLYVLPVLAFAGICHAVAFSPLFHHLTTHLGAEHAAELSGLLSTGALLANATGIATLGSVFFASPTLRVGFVRVLAIIALGMIPCTLAAARVARRMERDGGNP